WAVSTGTGIVNYGGSTLNLVNTLKTYCLNFDGSGDYVAIPEISAYDLEKTDSFTINLWVNKTSGGTGNKRLFSKAGDTASAGYHALCSAAGNTVALQLFDGTNTATSPVGSVTDAQWDMLTFTNDGPNRIIRTYVNGVEIGSGSSTTSITGSILNNIALAIATRGDLTAGFEFNGRIANAAFWNRLVGSVEVAAIYNKPTQISTTNLIGWWKLNIGTGTQASDSSANANHGSITNAIWDNTWFYPWRGTLGVWGYILNGGNVTDFDVRIGSSSTNYCENQAKQYAWKVAGHVSAFALDNDQPTYLLIDLDDIAWATKAINWASVNFIQKRWVVSGADSITFDYMTISAYDTIAVAGRGSPRRTIKTLNAITGASA
ncbi:MAG: LamG-like jellyroll fold domain-containing protein, partial [Candidatus Diapherotrites archaeon]|nr:LamG-like jellyroll fold domain-containing protein [Candidatus Diapherotrites archaeon]